MNMSDRIAIMDEGRIAQLGRPAEVYERPDNAFVGRFLGEANMLPVRVAADGGGDFNGTHFRAQRAAGLAGGDPALLFVRPEKMRIAALQDGADDPAGGLENRIDGRVQRVSYLGNIIRYLVDIGGGAETTIDVQNLTGAPAHAAGETVRLGWMAADCRLLPPETGRP